MKWSEVILTIQHFLVSLVYLSGFIYWEFVGDAVEDDLLFNFFSNLIWAFIVGLNPFIYISVNRVSTADVACCTAEVGMPITGETGETCKCCNRHKP
ncbi:unnamed protein product [Haemonchus placei]|uniref:G_PROTEIN_RECEP_F2_4 domain-containing protein n=1 Tax=Haemonchus placei TaxID=6290 RepID=A0A0N4X073_HAEPC|nr:unnamed protein product [Haemonchus placei]